MPCLPRRVRILNGILGFSLVALAVGPAAKSKAQSACKASPELEAQAGANASADVLTERGTWFGQHNQFACAESSFRKALQLDPGSAKLNYFLAFSLYSSGQKEAALAPLAESSRLDPHALQPLVLRASVLDELGRPREAEAVWKAALAIDPASSDALDGLVKDLTSMHDYFAAIALLQNVKRDEDLSLDLASAYGFAAMLDEAAATVKEALAADPSSLRLTKALATVYVHQQRYQDATALLHDFLAKDPGDQGAEIQYLGALVLTNNQEEATPLAKKLYAAAPHDFDVLYLKGILEKEAGSYAAARDHLREATALKPDDYSARYQLGAALARLGELPPAKQQLQRAIELSPSQAEAHFQLAGVLRSMGDMQGAGEQLAIFGKLKKDGLLRSEADNKAHRAREQLAAGDVAQAVDLYRQAVAATPENGLLQYQFAMALDEAKDTADERAALQKAVTLDPTFALATNQLGYVQLQGGEAPAAAANFRRAVQSAPEFTEAWINLAATLATEAKFSEAQEAVRTALKLEPANPRALELEEKLAAYHP